MLWDLNQLVQKSQIREMELLITQGYWDHERWGGFDPMSSSKAKLPRMELCAALDVSRGPTNASWKNLIHAPPRHDVLYLAFKRYKITSGFGHEPWTSCHLLSRLLSRSLLQILSPPRINSTYLRIVISMWVLSWNKARVEGDRKDEALTERVSMLHPFMCSI